MPVICPNVIICFQSLKFENNDKTQTWMKKHRGSLILLTMFSGSLMPALQFTNSGILGIEFFNNGISKIEMLQFLVVKLFGTVIFEVNIYNSFFIFFYLFLWCMCCVQKTRNYTMCMCFPKKAKNKKKPNKTVYFL